MVTRIPAKLLVVVTGVLSTAASLAGGLMMYYEGLSMLELTVREGAKADLSSMSVVLKITLELPQHAVHKQQILLEQRGASFHTYQELVDYMYHIVLGDVYSSDIFGTHMFIYSAQDQLHNKSGVSFGMWYDVLQNGSRQYVWALYTEEMYNASEDCPGLCNVCYSVDPRTTQIQNNVYNYTETAQYETAPGGLYYPAVVGWEPEGRTFWFGPTVWYAEDGRPMLYFMYYQVLRALNHIPLLNQMQVLQAGYVLSDEWQEQLLGFKTDSVHLLIATKEGVVIANNMGIPLAKEGCSLSSTFLEFKHCLVRFETLPDEVRGGAQKLKDSEPGVFMRDSGYWLSKAVLFEPSEKDILPEISLLWLRPTSTVEKELNTALVYFILFVLLVVVLDVAIGLVEVVLFARPLKRMAQAMRSLQLLDLDEANAALDKDRHSCVAVNEVLQLVVGINFAVASLREIKTFLPQSVTYDLPSDESSSAEEGRTNPTTCSGVATTASSKHQSGQVRTLQNRLQVSVENTNVVVAVLRIAIPNGEADAVSIYTKWLSAVQSAQSRCKAMVYRCLGELTYLSWTSVGSSWKNILNASELCVSTQEAFPMQEAGVAVDRGMTGNMGTETLRNFNILGEAPLRAAMLCRLNSELLTKLLVDGKAGKQLDSNPSFMYRPVERIRYGGSEAMDVTEVVGRAECANEEWMYTLSAICNEDYWKAWKEVLVNPEKGTDLMAPFSSDPVVRGLIHRVTAFTATRAGPYENQVQEVYLQPSVLSVNNAE